MKIEFEVGDRKYIYIAVAVVTFILVSAFQYNRNKGLKEAIKDNNKIIEVLEKDKKRLLTNVGILEEEKLAETKRADSMEVKEKYFKYKFYATDKKLKKLMADYAGADVDGKNDLFTGSLSN
jgi:hypothetical protein